MANDVTVTVKGKDELSSTLDGAQKNTSRFGTFLKGFGVAGAAAIAGIGVAAFKLSGDFEGATNTIIKGTGATGEALEGLEKDFKEVFRSIPTDMQSASSAIADFNTLTGATGEDLQFLATQALEAARIMGVDSAALIDDFGRAMKIFQVDAREGGEALDFLFQLSQETGIGIDALASQLQTFGPVMRNAGFSVEQTLDFFAQLHAAGIDVTRVMPGINAAVRKLAEDGVENLGEALFETIEQIRDASTETEALNIATETFGAEGAQRMVTAIRNDGIPALEDLGAGADDSKGAIDEAAAATQTLGDTWTEIKNNVLVALQPVLEDLRVKMNDLSETIGDAAAAFIDIKVNGEDADTTLQGLDEDTRKLTEAMLAWATVMEDIAAFINAVWPGVRFLLVTLFEDVTGAVELAIDIFNELRGVVEGVASAVSSAVSTITTAVDRAKRAIDQIPDPRDISIPNPVDLVRAHGGPVTSGRSVLVGERGPELFVPPSNGTIVPNGSLGGAGASVNVNISGDVNISDPRRDTGAIGDIGWAVMSALRSRGFAT